MKFNKEIRKDKTIVQNDNNKMHKTCTINKKQLNCCPQRGSFTHSHDCQRVLKLDICAKKEKLLTVRHGIKDNNFSIFIFFLFKKGD